ncbi:MAG: hypothetical protein Q8L55_02120 [Phycisphaerales bacterium]|nr:hypothetical protein [Phycisphaerales bacterium]
MNMKEEIQSCLRKSLASDLDSELAPRGFVRHSSLLLYVRKTASSIQKIDVAIEVHPKDRPSSAAALYPWLEVRIAPLDRLAAELARSKLINMPLSPICTLREPIEFTAAKKMNARWFIFQPDSVSAAVHEMRSFLLQWTLPFLDVYTTAADVCSAYDRKDERVINDTTQMLVVIAAMVACKRVDDAKSLAEQKFGKPGLRPRYQHLFDYLKNLDPA